MATDQNDNMNRTTPSLDTGDELLSRLGRTMPLDAEHFQTGLLARLNRERIHPSFEPNMHQQGWFSITVPRMAFASLVLLIAIIAMVYGMPFDSANPAARMVASLGKTNLSDTGVPYGKTIQTMHEGQASFLLADQSLIRLDNNSSAMIEGHRQITLKRGRLYAEVTRSALPEKFQITTQDIRIVVLGTAFEVSANSDETSVKVTKGKVQVTGDGYEEVLEAGEAFSIAKDKTIPTRTKTGKDAPAWIAKLQKAEARNPIIQAMQKHFPSRSLDLSPTP